MNFFRRALLGAGMIIACAMATTPAQAQFWQCAPYARMISGIDIHGNAGTWWNQAAGKYERGETPEVGSVMVLEPHGKMALGHVATVSEIVSPREIRVTHANWSHPGAVEHDVKVIDVSDNNDWSKVKVWYAPMGDVGDTAYPTYGFIYPKSAPSAVTAAVQVASNDVAGSGIAAGLR